MNKLVVLMGGVVFAIAGQVNAELLTNGDFEGGFTDWGSWGSGSGSGSWGYTYWSGSASVASSGGSDGGQYAVLDTTPMVNYIEWWGWVWQGVWQENVPMITGDQLAIEGYAKVLDQAGASFVNFFLEWRDVNNEPIDLNGDGNIVQGEDRTLLPFDLVGDDTWEHFDTLTTVPEPLGAGTIDHATVFVAIGGPIRVGLDQLSVSLVDEHGADFDGDGDVDGDDFLRWQGGFGTSSGAMKSDGDYDNDFDVDGDDFLGWQDEFGSASGAASAAVPEPASILLLIAALVGCVFVKRRN